MIEADEALYVDLRQPFGAWGIMTARGVSAWVKHWLDNSDDQDVFYGTSPVINRATGIVVLWASEVFNKDER